VFELIPGWFDSQFDPVVQSGFRKFIIYEGGQSENDSDAENVTTVIIYDKVRTEGFDKIILAEILDEYNICLFIYLFIEYTDMSPFYKEKYNNMISYSCSII